jgi:chitodextrinase
MPRNIRTNLLTHSKTLTVFSALLVLILSIPLSSAAGTAAAPGIALVKEVGSARYSSYTLANNLTIGVPAGGVAQGDTVILNVGSSSTGVVASGASDTQGNTYTVDVTKSSTSVSANTSVLSAYVSKALLPGDSIHVTLTGQASFILALASEWSGIAATQRVDATATKLGSSTALSSGSTATTTQADALVIGSFASGVNSTFAAGTGQTAFATQFKATLGSTYRNQWQEYRVVSQVGAYEATGTASVTGSYSGAVVVYKAAAAQAQDSSAPTAPSSLDETGTTSTSIGLTWSPSNDDVGVTGYDVYEDGALMSTTTSTSASLSGLTCGTTYDLAVDAFDAAGNKSPQSPYLGSTTPCDTTSPSSPANLTLTSASSSSLSVSWGSSTDNVGVAGYGIYRNAVLVSTSATNSATLGGLSCGTAYTVGVDAFDSANNRSAKTSLSAQTSACVTGTTPPTNSTAPNLVGTPQVGRTVKVDTGVWTRSPTSYSYQAQRADNQTFTTNVTNIAGATSNAYTLTTADLGRFVRIQVTATNASGSAAANSGAIGNSIGHSGIVDSNTIVVRRVYQGFNSDHRVQTYRLTDGVPVGDSVFITTGYSIYSNWTASVSDSTSNVYRQDSRNSNTLPPIMTTDVYSSLNVPNQLAAGQVISAPAAGSPSSAPSDSVILGIYSVTPPLGRTLSLDKTAQSRIASSKSHTSPSINPSTSSSFLLGVHGFINQVAPFWTPGAGWTELLDYGNKSVDPTKEIAVQYRQVSDTSAYASNGTISGTAGGSLDTILAYRIN